jgi:hypothetical protein
MAAGQQPEGQEPYRQEPDGYATEREFTGHSAEREFSGYSTEREYTGANGTDYDPHRTYREAAADEQIVGLPRALRDRYTVLGELPDPGSEADVLLVRDTAGPDGTNRKVIKIYRRGVHADPVVWAKVRELRSDHIVRFIETGTAGGRDYEVMEYVPGGNLAKLAAGRRPVPLDAVVRVVGQVSAALAELHRHGIVHRDLKPENILVRRADRFDVLDVVVTDFGLARAPEQSVVAASRTGTLAYLAPETLLSKGAQSSKARDWWALGMIVRDLLTGSRAFTDMTEAGIVQSLGLRPVDLGAVTDPRAHLLCRGLLLRDPAQRWGAEQVSDWLAGGTPAVADEPVTEAAGIKPITFQAVAYQDPRALALALGRSWDVAVARYFKPSENLMGEPSAWRELQVWLEQLREADGRDVEELYALIDGKLLSRSVAPDVKLLLLIQWLNPELPPIYRGRAMGRDNLAALAEHMVIAPQPEPGLSLLITDLRRHDLLPALARMRGGGGLAEVSTRWRQLNGQFGQLALAAGPVLPPAACQEVTDEDNPRRQAALLFLALDPQAHAARLREHAASLPGLLPMLVPWFDRVRAETRSRPGPLNDPLLLTLFPQAARESAAADLARREHEDSVKRRKDFWDERERQRRAQGTDVARALGNSSVIVGGIAVLFVITTFLEPHWHFTEGGTPVKFTVAHAAANTVTAIVVAALVIATELSLAARLGRDYPRFPRFNGRDIRQSGQRVHGVGRGCLTLIGIIVGISVALESPAVIYVIAGILQLRSYLRRRAEWKRVHEQERRQILGDAA